MRRLFYQRAPAILTRDQLLAEYPDVTPVAIHAALRRLVTDGEIARVAQGHYTLIDPRVAGPVAHRFSIVTRLFPQSAIAGWTSLSHWGLTDQIPHITDLAVVRGTHVRRQSPALRFVHVYYVPASEWWGIQRPWLADGEQVPMFSRERSLYDAFLSPPRYGGIGAALDVLNVAFRDTDMTLESLVEAVAQSQSSGGLHRLLDGITSVRDDQPDVSPIERRIAELRTAKSQRP